nr:GDSL-type esterase/lipase family protein [Actinomycetales bacterium]
AAGAPSTSGAPAAGLTPAAAEPADATDTATPPPLPPAQPTLVLGDSLGLVVYPWLADLLPDRYVSYEAVVGRSTPATESRLDQLVDVPPVVIVSSGTNDPVANVLEESARRILDRLGAARCVVWVDVVRPDRVGDSQTTMNAALDRAASGRPNVRVLRWTDLVATHPEWMSGDGIHPNEAGAQARARAFAEAAQGCSALDPAAPRAKREYLPQSAFWGPVSGQYRPPSGTGSTRTGSATGRSSSATPTSGSPASTSPATSPTPSDTAPSVPATTSTPPPAESTPPAASSPSTSTAASGPASSAAAPTASG